jgi:uncharacterized membrane protein YgaE (UPF0421/DUF939 family)
MACAQEFPMTQPVAAIPVLFDRRSLEHAARTAAGATLSLLVARLFKLPEAYWATVTTMIVLQSTLGAALSVSEMRFIGTAVGAVSGAVLASYFGINVWVFGGGVFLLGVLTAALRLDRSAYRFAGITLAIVMLVTRVQSPWIVAAHRFAEVTIGIVVGLLVTAAWPERQAQPT